MKLFFVFASISLFFFSSRRRHTRCALVTGVQTCALPISCSTAQLAGWTVPTGLVVRRTRSEVHRSSVVCRLAGVADPTGSLALMLDRLETLEREYIELQARLGDPELIADQTRYTQATRRYSELEDIVDVGGRLRATMGNAETARELSKESEGDDKELFRAEAEEAELEVGRLTEALKLLLLPKDPNEGRNG